MLGAGALLLVGALVAGLVAVDDGAVELAHEALARAWPRLRGADRGGSGMREMTVAEQRYQAVLAVIARVARCDGGGGPVRGRAEDGIWLVGEVRGRCLENLADRSNRPRS